MTACGIPSKTAHHLCKLVVKGLKIPPQILTARSQRIVQMTIVCTGRSRVPPVVWQVVCDVSSIVQHLVMMLILIPQSYQALISMTSPTLSPSHHVNNVICYTTCHPHTILPSTIRSHVIYSAPHIILQSIINTVTY